MTTPDGFARGDRVLVSERYAGFECRGRVMWVHEGEEYGRHHVRVAYGEMPGHPHRRLYASVPTTDVTMVGHDPDWDPFAIPADPDAADRVFYPVFRVLFRYEVGDPVWLPNHAAGTAMPATIDAKRQAWMDLVQDGARLGIVQANMLLPVSGHWDARNIRELPS